LIIGDVLIKETLAPPLRTSLNLSGKKLIVVEKWHGLLLFSEALNRVPILTFSLNFDFHRSNRQIIERFRSCEANCKPRSITNGIAL
jgi:hypothetical protein